MRNPLFIFGIIVCLIGVGLMTYTTIVPPEAVETKCYDRFSNEIVGSVCLDESGNSYLYFIITIMGIVIIFISTITEILE